MRKIEKARIFEVYFNAFKKIFLFVAIVLQAQIYACTIFNAQGDNGEVFVGNNCDTRDLSYAYYRVEPGDDCSFGALYFGSEEDRESGIFVFDQLFPLLWRCW